MSAQSMTVPRTAILFIALAGSLAKAGEPFTFGSSERIVFVGNDFFEHEAEQCYIETALTTRFPEKELTFRNLGYSGDTVKADARNLCAGWEEFGPADQGFKRLQSLVSHLQPTIIFVAYGMNESFAGESGLTDFQNGLDRMLDMLSASHARIVLISPIAHQKLPPPLPDPAEHNRSLELYVKAIETTAAKRGLLFVDLFHGFSPKTSDGIHLTAEGYQQAAIAIEKGLGIEPQASDQKQDQKLRELIIRKNFDFFNDWRAENDTYILGYRKHEQGRNAPELTDFEKLADREDAQIHQMLASTPARADLPAGAQDGER